MAQGLLGSLFLFCIGVGGFLSYLGFIDKNNKDRIIDGIGVIICLLLTILIYIKSFIIN